MSEALGFSVMTRFDASTLPGRWMPCSGLPPRPSHHHRETQFNGFWIQSGVLAGRQQSGEARAQIASLLDIQLPGDSETLDPFTQGGPRNAKDFGRFELVAAGQLHRGNGKLALQPWKQLQAGVLTGGPEK